MEYGDFGKPDADERDKIAEALAEMTKIRKDRLLKMLRGMRNECEARGKTLKSFDMVEKLCLDIFERGPSAMEWAMLACSLVANATQHEYAAMFSTLYNGMVANSEMNQNPDMIKVEDLIDGVEQDDANRNDDEKPTDSD